MIPAHVRIKRFDELSSAATFARKIVRWRENRRSRVSAPSGLLNSLNCPRAYDRCDLGVDALNRCLGFRVMFWSVQNIDGILRCLRGQLSVPASHLWITMTS
jgi:hypothetical protein